MLDVTNWGSLTVPIFCGVFMAGWGACYKILVRPLSHRLRALEAQVEALNAAKDKRIAALEKKLGLGVID